jgi:hypothetical protein
MKFDLIFHYLTATIAIGTTLTLSSMQMPVWELLFLTIIFYTEIVLANMASYHILFKMNLENKILNISYFILILILKYSIPFFLIITVTINNKTLLHDAPFTVCILRILVWLSFVLDWLIFYFRYDRKEVFTIRIFKWNLNIPSDNVYKTFAILLWSTVTMPIVHKIYKKFIRTEANIKR